MSIILGVGVRSLKQFLSTPASNTGVSCTLTVDWLSFTIKNLDMDTAAVIPFLDVSCFKTSSTGRNGYKVKQSSDYCTILSGAGPRMGRFFEFTGAQLRRIRHDFAKDDEHLLRWFSQLAGLHWTRMDWAVDFIGFGLDFHTWNEIFMNQCWVGGANTFRVWNEYTRDCIPSEAATFYIGAASSDVYLRIYNKREERRQALKSSQMLIPDDMEDWWRVEWQFRRSVAARSVATFLNKGMSGVIAGLRSHFDIVEVGADSNKRRWQPVKWWDEALMGVKRGIWDMVLEKWSFNRAYEYQDSAVARMIAKAALASGDVEAYLMALYDSGRHKMDAVDYEDIAECLDLPARDEALETVLDMVRSGMIYKGGFGE